MWITRSDHICWNIPRNHSYPLTLLLSLFCCLSCGSLDPQPCPCLFGIAFVVHAWSQQTQIQPNITDIGSAQLRSLYLDSEQMASHLFSQVLNKATAAGRQSESPSVCTCMGAARRSLQAAPSCWCIQPTAGGALTEFGVAAGGGLSNTCLTAWKKNLKLLWRHRFGFKNEW